MFIQKRRGNGTVLDFEKRKGDISFQQKSTIQHQLNMIRLTREDLQILMAIQPFVVENIHRLVEQFYENLEREPSLIAVIKKFSSIERLKNTLSRHIVEMFDGKIDDTFVANRIRIANVHVKIGLQTKWYMSAFQDLLLSFMEILEDLIPSKEEYSRAVKAVTKIMNLEQQLVLEAYEQETERIKKEVDEKKLALQQQVAGESQNLASIAEETNSSYQQLLDQMTELVSLANNGTKVSLLTQKRAEHGKGQIHKHSTNMANIHSFVETLSSDVQTLLIITKEMQEIVSIVTGIADQTQLLSLNASIEAARAGEYGRGFSIVAKEVKKLSEQTKKSVNDVSSLIKNTNRQVNSFTRSLHLIREEVKKANGSMKETETQFEEILKTTVETKLQNDQLEKELVTFEQTVNELGHAFDMVALSADQLSATAERNE